MADNETFRSGMMCPGCWAFYYTDDIQFRCKLGKFHHNRPGDVAPDRLRYQTYVGEGGLLKRWRCEYRFTSDEVEKMKAGKFRDVHVTKEAGMKVMEKANSTSIIE